MKLGIDYQQLLTSLRGNLTSRASWQKDTPPPVKRSCKKTFEPESIKPLELTANLQEIQRTEEHAKPYHGDIRGKNQTTRNFTG